MKYIGIVGSRRRNSKEDYNKIVKCFKNIFEDDDEIVSGGCPKGGDKFAEIIAKRFCIPITIYKANWKLGRHAGFFRNTDIAKLSNILIACVGKDRKGGTEDTIKKFVKIHSGRNLILC